MRIPRWFGALLCIALFVGHIHGRNDAPLTLSTVEGFRATMADLKVRAEEHEGELENVVPLLRPGKMMQTSQQTAKPYTDAPPADIEAVRQHVEALDRTFEVEGN